MTVNSQSNIRLLSFFFRYVLTKDGELFFDHRQQKVEAYHIRNDHGKNHGV